MALIHRILVPTDFSDGARHALDYAVEQARAFAASLVLAHAHTPPMIYAPEGVMLTPLWDEPELRAQLADSLAKLAAEVRERGIAEVSTQLLDGTPWQEIVRAAAEDKCDLIVMGTHGRGGLKHLFLGSVAERVVRKAPCPVLTVGARVP